MMGTMATYVACLAACLAALQAPQPYRCVFFVHAGIFLALGVLDFYLFFEASHLWGYVVLRRDMARLVWAGSYFYSWLRISGGTMPE